MSGKRVKVKGLIKELRLGFFYCREKGLTPFAGCCFASFSRPFASSGLLFLDPFLSFSFSLFPSLVSVDSASGQTSFSLSYFLEAKKEEGRRRGTFTLCSVTDEEEVGEEEVDEEQFEG